MTLQEIFIANLKRFRKERGLSQLALSAKCDTTSNYIGQIEMGRRIPSFDKIEKIAAALEIDPHELFVRAGVIQPAEAQPTTKDYLMKMPQKIKKEIIANLLAAVANDIKSSLDTRRY
jgi:transcriptional regulator with XRE-family HTH domain